MTARLHPDDIAAIARAVADEIERRQPHTTVSVDAREVAELVVRTGDRAANALDRAIALVGSQSRLANVIGTKQQNISLWRKNGGTAPAEYVLKIERATGVSRYDLRPDVYGTAPDTRT